VEEPTACQKELEQLKNPKPKEEELPPCPKWTGQACEGKDVKKCTRGNPTELQCVDSKCMCKEKTCYVDGQCVADGCHVAAAQVAAIQSAGGINSPLAQEAALRAGRKLDELSLNQNQGDGTEDPQAAKGEKPPSTEEGTVGGGTSEGTALQNVDATVSLPTYTPGMPVLIGRAKGHPKPEMEALMRKLYQVSDQLGGISEKQDKLYRDTPITNPGELAVAKENLKAGEAVENQIEAQPPRPASMSGAAVLAASIAPPLPRCSNLIASKKTEWSSFFPRASISE
jgi:hypothetical protein